MAQVTVKINGRAYQVTCEEGMEEHLGRLASFIDGKVKALTQELGPVGDTKLMVIAALTVADELADAYDELAEFRRTRTPPDPAANHAAETRAAEAEARALEAQSRAAAAEAALAELRGAEDRLAAGVERMAERVATIAESIGRA